jgi:uncharacterized membrane protein
MSDLIAIVFPTEAKADEVRNRVLDLQKQYLITLDDAVVAVKHEDGKIKLNQIFSTTAAGAAMGSFWGLLVGVLFMNPILGVAVGAASGALGGALQDFGINDAFMKQVSEAIQPGNAVLFLLVKKMTTDKVLADLEGVGGTVLRTSLDDAKEKALREALAAHISPAAAGAAATNS